MISSMRKRLGSKVKKENRLSITSNGSTGPPVSPIFPSVPPPTPTSPTTFMPKEDVIDSTMVRVASQKKNRSNLIRRLTSGDSSKINPNKCLNEQINCVPFIPNREMSRNDFIVKERIGEGNFGTVFRGEANGLYYPKSKTDVAIKTIHETSDPFEIEVFMAEIKILSNLDLHCNLVNMLGSHTTKIKETGEMWLLLEFCDWGDLKKVLCVNRKVIESSFIKEDSKKNGFNTRVLINWAFHIAKGMEYLANKRIMHGDLAARNVLITCEDKQGEKLVAKVCDFGLSKKITKTYYRKIERNTVPWKWMAFEFLENNVFKMKSDVWSYGVVIWEIFSLGKEPYMAKTYDEVIDDLNNDIFLKCPEKIKNIKSWHAEELYNLIVSKCFVKDENERADFSEIVKMTSSMLNEEELKAYQEIFKIYDTRWNLLLDDEIRDKLRNQTKSDRRTVCATKSNCSILSYDDTDDVTM